MKEFSLQHGRSAMKVGTDGTLLGAYAADLLRASPPKYVLDVGTGCGVIALMLAQAWTECRFVGIEIDEASAEEATLNALHSPYSRRISILQQDFCDFTSDTPFDLLISNPPFYTETHWSKQERENLAKHIGTITPTMLFQRAADLLRPQGGLLLLILPTSESPSFEVSAQNAGFHLHQLLRISTLEGDAPKRVIPLWGLTPPRSGPLHTHLAIQQSPRRHHYTGEYQRLLFPYLTIFQ